jgi:hypothetical protein
MTLHRGSNLATLVLYLELSFRFFPHLINQLS